MFGLFLNTPCMKDHKPKEQSHTQRTMCHICSTRALSKPWIQQI